MQQPPPLPEVILDRVVRLARADGMSVLIVAGVFALFAAAGGEISFALVFLLGAGAGAIEVHGAALLQQGEPRGLRWLIASQPFLLLIVWAYCVLRLAELEVTPIPDMLRDTLAMSAQQLGMTIEGYWRFLHRVTIGILAGASLIYQTVMTIYYWRRRGAVTRALALD